VPAPLVVTVEMGLGHLRAAAAVAGALGQNVLYADRTPLALGDESRLWERARGLYEGASRLSQMPGVGAPMRAVLAGITHIPHLHPGRDLSAPSLSTHLLERLFARGLGAGLADEIGRTGSPAFATHFIPALAADHHGCREVACLVTDSDLARAWVRDDPARSTIRYFAPTDRAGRRLAAYGVPRSHVVVTGFPLPDELLGGPELPILRGHLARRLGRLDPLGVFRASRRAELAERLGEAPAPDGAAPLVVFAVGGAGAQADLPERFLPSLRPRIEEGRLRLALLAGARADVARRFEALLASYKLAGHPGARVVAEPDLSATFGVCNALLAEADVLWTKPSELTFFAALGLPLVLSAPVGAQEGYNHRFAVEQGAALAQRDPRFAGDWIVEWLENGTLAGAAWSGFTRLPKRGLYRILDAYGIAPASPSATRFRVARADGSTATQSLGS
jgi:hypothetical protein